MKILLLGRNGQVGWELQRSLGVLGKVIGLTTNVEHNAGDLRADFRDLAELANTVRQVQPDVIVNAAA